MVSIAPVACAHGAPQRARGPGPKLHEARRASPGTGGGEVLIARTHHDRGARVSLERLVLAGASLLLKLLSGQLILRQIAIRALQPTNAATARTERRHSGQCPGHRRASLRTKHTACRPRSRDSRSTKACDPQCCLCAAFYSRALLAGNTRVHRHGTVYRDRDTVTVHVTVTVHTHTHTHTV